MAWKILGMETGSKTTIVLEHRDGNDRESQSSRGRLEQQAKVEARMQETPYDVVRIPHRQKPWMDSASNLGKGRVDFGWDYGKLGHSLKT